MSNSRSQQMEQASPRGRIQSYLLGAILVLLLLAVLRLFAPFFTFLLWSTLLYVIVSPVYRRVIKNIDNTTIKGSILHKFWAVVFTLATMAVIYVPVLVVFVSFVRQAMAMAQGLIEIVAKRPEALAESYEWLANMIRSVSFEQIAVTPDDIDRYVRNFLITQRENILSMGTNIVKNIATFSLTVIIYTLIMAFSLFFFFSDGPYLSKLFLRIIPIKREYISTLTGKFQDITRNLFLGYIMVALSQATFAFILFSIFGVKGALVFAVITFILVFIPLLGPIIMWLPLGAIMVAGGEVGKGILFMVLCGLFVSGTENILRPVFLKDRIKLHPLIIFFAILGGLTAFGFNGLILGPMLVIFFLTVLDLFLAEHRMNPREPG